MAVASAGLYASLHLIPDNHAKIPPLSFLQAGCPSCQPVISMYTGAKTVLRTVYGNSNDFEVMVGGLVGNVLAINARSGFESGICIRQLV